MEHPIIIGVVGVAVICYAHYMFSHLSYLDREIKKAQEKKDFAEKIIRKIERAKEVKDLAADFFIDGKFIEAEEYIRIAQDEDRQIESMLARYNRL